MQGVLELSGWPAEVDASPVLAGLVSRQDSPVVLTIAANNSFALRHDAQALVYWVTAFNAAITSAWCVASAKWPASSMMIRRFFGAETLLKYASTSGVGAKRSYRPW